MQDKRLIVAAYFGDRIVGDPTNDPVPWWSVTKTCLAAAALALVARGKLDLDTELPGRPFTLRNLLQHTSGLRCYGELPEYHAAVERNDPPWSEAELLARVPLDDLKFKPGRDAEYSNVGYFLVRRLIEHATGADIGAALRTLVLTPLGIPQVVIAREPEDLEVCAWGNRDHYHPGWVYHGLLIGAPKEAVRFLHGLMTGSLLPPHLREAMLQRYPLDVPLEGRPWKSAGYGLGLMMDIASPLGLCVGHSGAGPGSVSAAYHFPELNPPRTVAAFAPLNDDAVVERAVLEAAELSPV